MATVGVMEYFKHVFDMTANETVAIMGAHTLGFASRNQSGFDGPGGWDSHPLVLDNKYGPLTPEDEAHLEMVAA